MKFFRVKPDYSWHCEGECDVRNANDRVGENFQIEGWFKLADKNFLNHGEPEFENGRMKPGTEKRPGCIKLKMSWVYDKRFDARTAEGRNNGLSMTDPPPDMTALEQLQLNSAETQLRLGNPLLVTQMLDSFPLLLDVKASPCMPVYYATPLLCRLCALLHCRNTSPIMNEFQFSYLDKSNPGLTRSVSQFATFGLAWATCFAAMVPQTRCRSDSIRRKRRQFT